MPQSERFAPLLALSLLAVSSFAHFTAAATWEPNRTLLMNFFRAMNGPKDVFGERGWYPLDNKTGGWADNSDLHSCQWTGSSSACPTGAYRVVCDKKNNHWGIDLGVCRKTPSVFTTGIIGKLDSLVMLRDAFKPHPLTFVKLTNYQSSGTLDTVGKSLTKLRVFGLYHNFDQLGGTLDSLGHMTELRNLSLVLPGYIGGNTTGLRNLKYLEHLEWSATLASGMTGDLEDLKGMRYLRNLSVPNALNGHGKLSVFGAENMPQLRHLDARLCALTDSLDKLRNISKTLEYIDVSENAITPPKNWRDFPLWSQLSRSRCNMLVNLFPPPIPSFVTDHCKIMGECIHIQCKSPQDCGTGCTQCESNGFYSICA